VVALRQWVVGHRGSAWRRWPAVAGGRVLGQEGGPVRAGIAEALGSGGAALVAPFGASASMIMELAWGWKVEEAPVAQLLGCSRHSRTARSTAADLTRAESRGTRWAQREENVKGKPSVWSSQRIQASVRAAHVGSVKLWAVGACGHRRGNNGAGGAAVQTGCTWSARVGGSCLVSGLRPF
jgi:hypothetical protein